MRRLAQIAATVLWVHCQAHGAIQSSWTNTYDTPRYDSNAALAQDSQNNVCTLISSEGAVALVKYSPSGSALWTNRFNSPLQDLPAGLAVAPDDSLIASLVASTNSNPGNLILLKYGAAGSLSWVRDGDITNADSGTLPAVTVDSEGNVFVAAVTGEGYTLIKCDATGRPQWTNHFAIPGGYFPSTTYFGTDAAGNAILVYGLINFGRDQMVLLKCSRSGSLSAAVHEWPQPNDFLTGAASDSAGNIYIAASVQPAGSGSYHLQVAKYNPQGTMSWSSQRAPAPGFHHLVSHRIALDSASNVIVTAYETSPVTEDEDEYQTLTLKYSADGEILWSARARGFDRRPTGLAVDRENTIYVVSGDSGGQSTLLTSYRVNGSQSGEALVPDHSPGQIVTGMPGEFYVNFSGGAVTRKFLLMESPSPLSATIAPAVTNALPGSSVTFEAVVSGNGPFAYDWRYQGLPTGETNSTLTINNVQFAWRIQGDYTVIVSNATEWTISPEAHLEVFRPPMVSLHTSVQYVSAGESAVITGAVSGTAPISLTWQRNGQTIAGATNESIPFASVQPSDGGSYTLVASNIAGSATSLVSILHVILPPVSFTNAMVVQVPTNGPAIPYPSEIPVAGLTGQVVKVNATLRGLNSETPSDLVVLLQAPSGKGILLMSRLGEDASSDGATLTFDDDARLYVSDDFVETGVYLPGFPDSMPMPAPAPQPPWETRFSQLIPDNPNGVWRLFAIQRDLNLPAAPARLDGGWNLTFLLSDSGDAGRPRIKSITRNGSQVSLSWDPSPGWRLQRKDSLTDPNWTDVPGTLGSGQISLPIGTTSQFFRLVR